MGKNIAIGLLGFFGFIWYVICLDAWEETARVNLRLTKIICDGRGAEVSKDKRYCIAKDTRVLSAIE